MKKVSIVRMDKNMMLKMGDFVMFFQRSLLEVDNNTFSCHCDDFFSRLQPAGINLRLNCIFVDGIITLCDSASLFKMLLMEKS